MSQISQWLSIIVGLVAAVLWLWSALVRIPNRILRIDAGFVSGGKDADDDLDLLTKGLARQGRLSAWAAAATGLSVLLQAVSTLASLAAT